MSDLPVDTKGMIYLLTDTTPFEVSFLQSAISAELCGIQKSTMRGIGVVEKYPGGIGIFSSEEKIASRSSVVEVWGALERHCVKFQLPAASSKIMEQLKAATTTTTAETSTSSTAVGEKVDEVAAYWENLKKVYCLAAEKFGRKNYWEHRA